MALAVKNLFAVGGATLFRLIGTLLLYALIARAFGPAVFGEFAYWYALGIVLGAVSDYGFCQQILINLAKGSQKKIKFFAERFVAGKLFLVFVLYSLAFVGVVLTSDDAFKVFWLVFLLASTAAATLIEFFGVMLRARGLYRAESKRTFVATFVANIFAASVGFLYKSIFLVCVVMLLIRVGVLFYQFKAARKCTGFDFRRLWKRDFYSLYSVYKKGFSFALDGFVVQLISNADVFLAKFLMTASDVGLYLAGNRLVQATLAGIPVLANIYVPQMASFKDKAAKILPGSLKYIVFSVSFCVLVFFWFGSDYIPGLIFGAGFIKLGEFFPVIGLLVAIRYLGSLDGFVLSVGYHQKIRALIHVVATVFYVVVAVLIWCEYVVYPSVMAFMTVFLWAFVAILFRLAVIKLVK